jgi:GntR family transcriptional regulator, transcriptional repressor for pyruvate dehydrogenase complex
MGKDIFSAAEVLTAVKRTAIHQEIVDQIEKLLDNGRLKHGDQLPPERRLAEIFHTSRHSVREAIRTLVQKGLLRSRIGSGTYVIIEDRPSVVDYLSRAVLEDRHELPEIFQFRRMIEPQIAALAAENADAENLRRLQELVEKQKNAEGDFELFADLDQMFHRDLARATHNRILLKVVERLNDILMKSRVEIARNQDRMKLAVDFHAKILEAVANRDGNKAAEIMQSHLSRVEQLALGMIPETDIGTQWHSSRSAHRDRNPSRFIS